MSEAISAEGVVRAMRMGIDTPGNGEREDCSCVCCEGRHIFSYRLDLELPPPPSPFTKSIDDLAYRFLTQKRNGKPIYEGRRFRVTVEILPGEESLAA